MKFREARFDEIKEIAHLHNELVCSLKNEVGDVYWDFEALPLDETARYLEVFFKQPERRIFISLDRGRLIGYIAAEIIPCHLPMSSVKKVGYIAAAYVKPEYRRKNVMRRLESLAADFFKTCGLQYIELNFLTGNTAAKKAWESLGYQTFRAQARKRI